MHLGIALSLFERSFFADMGHGNAGVTHLAVTHLGDGKAHMLKKYMHIDLVF